MEAAAIISIALVDYPDFIVRRMDHPWWHTRHRHAHMTSAAVVAAAFVQLIVGLLLINATIGYYEDQNAGNAVAALKSQLAPQSKVRPRSHTTRSCIGTHQHVQSRCSFLPLPFIFNAGAAWWRVQERAGGAAGARRHHPHSHW